MPQRNLNHELYVPTSIAYFYDAKAFSARYCSPCPPQFSLAAVRNQEDRLNTARRPFLISPFDAYLLSINPNHQSISKDLFIASLIDDGDYSRIEDLYDLHTQEATRTL